MVERTLKLANVNRKNHLFRRIVTIYASHQSNARRSKLINQKREAILRFFDQYGEDRKIYRLYLNQVNEIVPQKELINHISVCLGKNEQSSQKIIMRKSEQSSTENMKKVLFPYQHKAWNRIAEKRLTNQLPHTMKSLESTYLQLQLFCLYKLEFSIDRVNLYHDIRDFSVLNRKFNFIKFFNAASSNNLFIANKYSERLIKSISWRTQESQQFLLIMSRALTWQQFCYSLETFVSLYQEYYTQQ